MMLIYLLLAAALGLGFVALLLFEHSHLMVGSHTLDGLRLEVLELITRCLGGWHVGT